MKINLDELTNKQQVKAFYLGDVAFNEVKFFIYDKDRNSFILNSDSDFEYNLQHIAFDDEFQVFLVEYNEIFNEADWSWDNPNVDKSSMVTPLKKDDIIQLKELLAEI